MNKLFDGHGFQRHGSHTHGQHFLLSILTDITRVVTFPETLILTYIGGYYQRMNSTVRHDWGVGIKWIHRFKAKRKAVEVIQ